MTGAVYFAGTLYWLVETMTTFGGLPTAVALFAAAAARRLPLAVSGGVRRGPRAAAFARRLRASRCGAPRRRGWRPSSDASTCWDGFPWALLGYSQVTDLPVAQVASVVGVYGLSGLLALTSAAAAFAIVGRGRERWRVVAASGGDRWRHRRLGRASAWRGRR